MNEPRKARGRTSRFPPSLFFVYLGVLLLMSGIHTGLIVGMSRLGWSKILQTEVPMLYWAAVAVGLTLFTREQIHKNYEAPLHELAEATRSVAAGDFSVYVPTTHTADRYDYLDQMILDFNRMVEELGSIETLKTDFVASVSHEIKTPLSVIANHAELLTRPGLSEAERQEYVQTIRAAVRRLTKLQQNMLKLNRLEKQGIRPVPERYDVTAQLSDCALQFEEQWEEKNLEFEADLSDRVLLEADAGLLELVWTNLLGNAVKFTPPGGTIRLSQKVEDGHLVVAVSDTGCGMDEKTLRHIFEKFYQGDTSHATEGNGLGLALVQRVLQLSGGTISVKSRPGEGSTFTVVLPLLQKE